MHAPSHVAPGAWGYHDRPTPHGALPEAGPGTGWRGGSEPGDTLRVAWGGRAWAAFSLGHARQQGCAQQPNAGRQLLPEAGARHEQTLEAVSCTPWLGAGYEWDFQATLNHASPIKDFPILLQRCLPL